MIYPEKLFLITNHCIPLNPAPYYHTQEGRILANHFLDGTIPAGVFNRMRFLNKYPHNTSAKNFLSLVDSISKGPAYVNIAAKSEIKGRTLTIKAQAYFTDDSKVAHGQNYIHIVLLQNNI